MPAACMADTSSIDPSDEQARAVFLHYHTEQRVYARHPEHLNPAYTLLCLAAPFYPVALITYSYVSTDLWLVCLWIAMSLTFAAAACRCLFGP